MAALEKHYTVAEVAGLWGLSEDTIRRLFRDDPAVLKIGAGEKRYKRGYVVLRIPESVVLRTHEKLRAPR
jgi:predicted transcriptional regulator